VCGGGWVGGGGEWGVGGASLPATPGLIRRPPTSARALTGTGPRTVGVAASASRGMMLDPWSPVLVLPPPPLLGTPSRFILGCIWLFSAEPCGLVQPHLYRTGLAVVTIQFFEIFMPCICLYVVCVGWCCRCPSSPPPPTHPAPFAAVVVRLSPPLLCPVPCAVYLVLFMCHEAGSSSSPWPFAAFR
jgi:hypothetical protein